MKKICSHMGNLLSGYKWGILKRYLKGSFTAGVLHLKFNSYNTVKELGWTV